jgi:hypothetical protein
MKTKKKCWHTNEALEQKSNNFCPYLPFGGGLKRSFQPTQLVVFLR